jgi:hypothetical protein
MLHPCAVARVGTLLKTEVVFPSPPPFPSSIRSADPC